MSSTDHSPDNSSDRLYDDPPHIRFCAHQTAFFNGHECSRYFDCPAHTARRPGSDNSAEEADNEVDDDDDEGEEVIDEELGNEEAEDEDITESVHEDDAESPGDTDIDEQELVELPGPQGVSPLESGEQAEFNMAEEEIERDAHNGAPGPAYEVIDLTTPSPRQERQYGSDAAGPSNPLVRGDRHMEEMGQPRVFIDLTEDSPEPSAEAETRSEERALPTTPVSASRPNSSLSRGGAISPSNQRRPTTPPSPPPPTRRRTSTNNSETVPRANMMQAPMPPPSRRPSELVLPRWQPDAEVTFCPICRTQFSFLIRKHHCRKCGRVVCARCSPHRITIPYQYIVQPPGTPRPGAQRYPASLISGEGGHADFSSLGGGEKVRLCNPCVPDPNTNPPDSQGSPSSIRGHVRSQSSVGSGGAYGSNTAGPSQPGSYFDAHVRNRSATMLPSVSRNNPGGRFYQSPQSRILSGTPPSNYPHTHAASPFGPYRTPRHRSAYEVGQSSSSSSATAQRRPLPPDPPQLAEEDECPICHRELPPQSLANSEELREAHINTCITSHSTYGGLPGGEDPRPRRTGMFPYVATEKDCVDSAECTICLEEFEAGVPMARLECLCRFHRDCISRWFAKNPGRCPVHSHDGHGF